MLAVAGMRVRRFLGLAAALTATVLAPAAVVAAKGVHAVTFSENPEKLGYPSIHSEHWDPFWQACSEENTVVCLHIGSSSQVVITSIDAPVDTLITLQPINIVQAAADLVWLDDDLRTAATWIDGERVYP